VKVVRRVGDPILATQIGGNTVTLLSDGEFEYHSRLTRQYQHEYKLTDPSDVSDLDRLIMYETQLHRAANWLSAGCDYDGRVINIGETNALQRMQKELTLMVSTIKNDLGMNKAKRDQMDGESVGAYLVKLRQRAKEFGVHREEQLQKALELINELKSLVGTFDRSNALERQKSGLESEADILEWIRLKLIPEYDAIDEHFRQNVQRFWHQDPL
jgi:hypothetical protein